MQVILKSYLFGGIVIRENNTKQIAKVYVPIDKAKDTHVLFPKVKIVNPSEVLLHNKRALRKALKKLRD